MSCCLVAVIWGVERDYRLGDLEIDRRHLCLLFLFVGVFVLRGDEWRVGGWWRALVAGDAWWVVCNSVRCFLSLRKCLHDRQMLPVTGLRWISKKGRGLEPLCIGVDFSQWGVEGN